MAFQGTKTLNRIQSVVFDTAYKNNDNLLICAPTGAGKTNIAMLCVLHELKQHVSQGVIKKDEFKVRFNIYNQFKHRMVHKPLTLKPLSMTIVIFILFY